MAEPIEQWLPVPGYELCYQVSSAGRVWSIPRYKTRGGYLRPSVSRWGYLQVGLCRDSKTSTRFVHCLVAAAFLGPRPDGLEVRHLDGNPRNNVVPNLRYGTKSENAQDRLRHGHHAEAAKTHCPRNHPYDEANTRYDQRGSRYCLACKREKIREWRKRRKATRAAIPAA